jgi:hypothetical protein
MQNLPFYVSLLFVITTAATLWFLFKASKNSGLVLLVSIAWLALQAVLAYTGFYTRLDTMPPRLFLLPGPPVLFILVLFIAPKGRQWIANLNLKTLTWLHTVRIPVEITLYLLFTHGMVPKLMTFEGVNPDILSGISAIPVALLLFKGEKPKRLGLIIWNIACLLLLANIVYHAVFSTPYPFQKFGFEQPNIAIFYFPFVWLPCFVVPVVLLAHLAALKTLLVRK